MAWSGDQAEGRGPGPPLGAPMAILPYGYPGSHQISDMVAFPSHGPQGRNQGAAVDYMAFDKLPATKTKLRPRAGTTAAWEHQLKEILAGVHLTDALQAPSPPTGEQVAIQLATSGITMTQLQVQSWTAYLVSAWWRDSNMLYHIVYQSLDLTGPFEEADLKMIERDFWTGDYRLGCKLYQWAISHVSAASVASQSDLMDKVANMKLTPNPTYEVFAAHCFTLLMLWRSIASNDTGRPAQFYYRLVKSIPELNDSSKLGQLRSWLTGKIADDDPALADPVTFIDTFCKRAATIGTQRSDHQLSAMGGKLKEKGDKKECKHCTSKICRGGEFANTIQTCICMNSKIRFRRTRPLGSSSTCSQRDPMRKFTSSQA